ncbi:hybrid sensor histidine kinase/response regulator [Lacinutrix sp. Bg11-31]|nr:hybrid sensor histidine kinase/response regulator [Lacinutrix sp. Bg11-31]
MQGVSLKNKERAKRAAELIIANLELKFMNQEKAKRAAELVIANIELVFQNDEKSKRAAELAIANKELVYQNDEKAKRAAELIIANIELVYQNHEKSKRAIELHIANKELLFQNEEKEKRAAELVIANKELLFQNKEKEKRAAELVQAKEKAEYSDLLKSAFLANMSHEIRTPMNGILGFADLLNEPELTGETKQEYIDIIKESGTRMLNIINDIISISKIESGLMELNIRELNINKQVDFIYSFFKPQIEEKGIRFIIKNSLSEEEAIINSDSEKIYGILTNVIKNAIKYTEKGTIELGYGLKTKREPKEIEFYVKDTGIGIPKSRQEAIFERFIQSDLSDEKSFEGAGLGLSISKAYVELLGGKIWVESKVKKGSTFYFTIPCKLKERVQTIKPMALPNKVKKNLDPKDYKLKILIAEDDNISTMLLSALIEIYCLTILRAKTGLETVELCRANPDIDLVLMDIQMPKLGGLEATREIRKFNNNIIIIAQTASVIAGDQEKIIEMGCNDYISKPINKNNLFNLVEKYFDVSHAN